MEVVAFGIVIEVRAVSFSKAWASTFVTVYGSRIVSNACLLYTSYVEKPFDAELLLVKIRSLLRRSYEYTQSDREYLESGLVYDRGQGILLYKNQPIEMTKSENRIMSILADYKGQVVDREKMCIRDRCICITFTNSPF